MGKHQVKTRNLNKLKALGKHIRALRNEKGLTQEQLAELAGTNKSYISKLEKDVKDVRFSTLQRIIKDGLGGHLQISIKF